MAEDYRYDAFISYRHQEPDRGFARQLVRDLEAAGFTVALDERDFSAQATFLEEMERCVRESRFTLTVLSPRYLESGNTTEEAIITKVLDMQERRRRLIPLLTEAVSRPIWMYDIVGIDFTAADPFVPPLAKLKQTLRAAVPGASDRDHSPPAPPFNVPYPQNPLFTGRDAELTELHTRLTADRAAALTQAIAGLGGVGKTQTALDYAYRHRADYPAGVLWVRAETQASLTASFAEIARLLMLPEQDAQEAGVVTAAVTRWLDEQAGYLLILDNVEDPRLVHGFLPLQPRGRVLITSRLRQLQPLQKLPPLSLPALPPEEAVQLLLARAARPGPSPDERRAAEALANELGCLPLALEQAGAYIGTHDTPFSAYLADYRALQLKLLEEHGPPGPEYPETVRTTWSKSFAAVQARSPEAAALLTACAFLAPEPIPEVLLLKGGDALGEPLAPALAVARQRHTGMDRLLGPLLDHSLIRRDPETAAFEVHRLVQAVVRDALPEVERRLWSERVVAALAWAYPGQEFADWPACDRWLPHAQAGAAWIEAHAIVSRNAGTLLNQAWAHLRARARYREAEPLLVRSLAAFEQTLGPDHPDTATILNNLGLACKGQGKLLEAEPLYQRALAIREQALGPEHPITAESLNNLAGLCHARGKLAEAEPLLQRALAIDQAAYGSEHPVVASDLNNLAALYRDQGKPAEAEPLYQRALSIREQALGPEHPDTAQSLNNLAAIYQDRGKLAEAEPLLGRAIKIREVALGTGHPDTAQSFNNLASLYQVQGRLSEAEPLYHQALGIREQVFGPMHSETAESLNNLGGIYFGQGKLAEAEPLFQRALTIYEHALGPLHYHTATSLNNLAEIYRTQGKLAEAEPLHQRALAIREEVLGSMHPSTAASLNNLALLYRAQGKLAEAEPLLRRALAIMEAVVPDHPNTETTRKILARLRAEMKAGARRGVATPSSAAPEGAQRPETRRGTVSEGRDQLFISYSHRDKRWLDRLLEMLQPLQRDRKLDAWSDQRIQPGARWKQEIEAALGRAKVAVLLVSPPFLASDFIAKNELPPLLGAAEYEGLTIIWVAVSASLYQHTPIGDYQCANEPARPLDSLRGAQQNRVLKAVAERILAAATSDPR